MSPIHMAIKSSLDDWFFCSSDDGSLLFTPLGSVSSNFLWQFWCVLLQFNDILNTIFSSAPTVAMIVGTILDNTLEAKHAKDERGIPWWVPFQRRKGDVRNEEFYSYPLRIHELVPSRFLWEGWTCRLHATSQKNCLVQYQMYSCNFLSSWNWKGWLFFFRDEVVVIKCLPFRTK